MSETKRNRRQSKEEDKKISFIDFVKNRNPVKTGFRIKIPSKINSALLLKTGLILIFLSFGLILYILHPVISKEIWYFLDKPNINASINLSESAVNLLPAKTFITPVDFDFSIVIPKIGANTKVFKNVDTQQPKIYQEVLTKGVAHALGTSLPDSEGNTFIFAHSSDSFYNANQYNAVFYLLNKLEKGDKIYLVYEKKKYTYEVSQTLIVNPDETKYMEKNTSESQITLMTCWPAGTTLKRLLVIGKKIN
jgi:sortase A